MSIWEIKVEVLREGRDPRYRRIDVEADSYIELAEKMRSVRQREEKICDGIVNVIGAELQA